MNNYRDIITIEPGKRSGQPCIRGMRITVYDVFEYLASGMTVAEVLHDFPELTETDIRACFAYAAEKEKSQVVVYTDETSIRSEPIRPTGDTNDLHGFIRDQNTHQNASLLREHLSQSFD